MYVPRMSTWINGEIIEDAQARVMANDRGFLYGDGVFETFRAYEGRFFRFEAHWARLQAGARCLRLTVPSDSPTAAQVARALLAKNGLSDAVVRMQLTRGPGKRGNSIQGASQPTWIMTCHPLPAPYLQGCRLFVSAHRLPSFSSFRQFKTCNRLPQILAHMEAEDAKADDALLLNEKGCVVEAASANVFWVEDDVVCTPALESGALPGITRAAVMEICQRLEIECVAKSVALSDLLAAEAVFLTQSVRELIPVTAINGVNLASHILVERLSQELHALALREAK